MVPEAFAEYGFNFLWCFNAISRTSADPELRRTAWNIGRERALRWRYEHQTLEPDADARAIHLLISGSLAADMLGVPDESLKRSLAEAAAHLSPEEVFGFDPAKEPPPPDIPKNCRKCGEANPRGSRECKRCRAPLEMWDRYEVFCDAIIVSFFWERYGVRMGAGFGNVARWLPRMSPYPEPDDGERLYRHAAYAITHVIYAFNDYSRYRLRREWFPNEFDFLKSHLMHSIEMEDPELTGEYLDTLKSFGLTDGDSTIDAGMRFLLARQNSDGSWGDASDPDIYHRYHSTWTAIDGLRDYAWSGEGVTFPAALWRARANQLPVNRGR